MLLRKSLLAAFLIFLTLAPQLQLAMNGGGEEEKRLPVAFETELLSIPKAHAEEGDPFFLSDLGQKFFVGLLHVFTVLNWLALSMVQALLSPDVIFGEMITSGPMTGTRPMELILRNIWVTSRNIVNGIFAFILLFAGIYLIVKADSDAMGKIKSGAKNFVIAVILVNFSWFFPRVILDISSVLTSVIYQLPALVNPGLPCSFELGPDGIPGGAVEDAPCRYVWRVHLFPTMGECAPGMPPSPACFRPVADNPALPPPLWGKSYWDFVDIFYVNWKDVATRGSYYDDDPPPSGRIVPVSGADVIVNGLAVNFAKIPSFNLVDFKDMWLRLRRADGIDKTLAAFLKYFIELIMHVILSVAVGLALLALAAVLVVRVAVLWLTIAFMPFIFIGFALRGPGGMGELGVGEAQAPNIWKTFLGYAFLPAIVAIPFAIGFSLMSQLYYVKAMSIPLPIHGMETILPKGVDSFHELLWMIISIAIIWFGVFSILAKDKIAGGIVQGIKGIGTTAMKTAGYGAMSVPLPLLPGGIMGVVRGFDRLKRLPDTMRFGDIAGKTGGAGVPAPPPMERVIRASEGLTKPQFAELKDILLRTNAGNASSQFNAFAEKLARLSPLLNADQAKGLAMNEHALREFLSKAAAEEKITPGEQHEMLRHAEHFQALGGGGAAGGAAAPTVRVNLNVNAYSTMSAGDIKKDVAENYFHTPGMDAKSVKKDLEANIERATVASVKDAIREVASEIREDMDATALKEKLQQINPGLPPPHP